MSVDLWITVGYLTLWLQISTITAQSCGSIGSLYTPQWTPNTTSSFYLNIDERTRCAGYVTEVQISFYNNTPSEAARLVTYFAFYRPESSSENNFVRVSAIQHVNLSRENVGNAIVFPISPEIYVEEDTLLGACIVATTPQVAPLLIVSANAVEANSDRLLAASCTGNDQILPSSVGLGERENVFQSVLHIHASVEEGGNTVSGGVSSNGPNTEARTNNGSPNRATADPTNVNLSGYTTTDTTEVIPPSHFTTMDASNRNRYDVISGVIGTVSGIAFLLTLVTLLIILHQKLKRKTTINDKTSSKLSNPDITLTGINTTDEPYVHYSLPSQFRTMGFSGQQNPSEELTSNTVYESNNTRACPIYAKPVFEPQKSQHNQNSHHGFGLQVNGSYNSLEGMRSHSHHSFDLQVNGSYNGLDLQGMRGHSHHSIDLQDNLSYNSHDPQDTIDLQDNRCYCSLSQLDKDRGIDMQINYSYSSPDLS